TIHGRTRRNYSVRAIGAWLRWWLSLESGRIICRGGVMASRTAMNRFFPLLACLTQYSAKMARVDLIAGVAVAGLLIPEGMAYAGIAGVPPRSVCMLPCWACLFTPFLGRRVNLQLHLLRPQQLCLPRSSLPSFPATLCGTRFLFPSLP